MVTRLFSPARKPALNRSTAGMVGDTQNDDRSYTIYSESTVSDESYQYIDTPAESVNGDILQDDVQTLPYRAQERNAQSRLHLSLDPTPEKDGVLVTISPPLEPRERIEHSPCDIVLCIDVSGSMSAEAPAPVADPEHTERNGLTVLDLTKHAARTILETLDETDRLGLVSFSTEAKTIQPLLPMTPKNKTSALMSIESLRPESMTNLWHGILESIKMFEGDERSNCVPAIMILTDGLPNHMCPQQGYVPKIRSYKLPATLHTFGFGYSLRSGLLKSIAEIGGGNYAFIPESGMLGTVFVHAVANLQATYATKVTLELTTTNGLQLSEITGDFVKRAVSEQDERDPKKIFEAKIDALYKRRPSQRTVEASTALTIYLDNIQYGQSREILLKYEKQPQGIAACAVRAKLGCTPTDGTLPEVEAECNHNQSTELLPAAHHYHKRRAEMCELLSNVFPLNTIEEHQLADDFEITEILTRVESLAHKIRESKYEDPFNNSLLEDLAGPAPSGQVRLAVSNVGYFNKWGKHYLLSLLNAHQKQICNSFKDPGPLQYGSQSPLFVKCRDALDFTFDNLPPPRPSRAPKDDKGQPKFIRVDMRKYHRKGNPCFAGDCMVTMSNGEKLWVKDMRSGMMVKTPKGAAVVRALVATKVENFDMIVLGDLKITGWHPVCVDGSWRFPAKITDKRESYDGIIYSVMLERNRDPAAHALQVGGHWAVTLGHGIVSAEADVRSHDFLGNYAEVEKSLAGLPEFNGVLLADGVAKDEQTDLVCGFVPALEFAVQEPDIGAKLSMREYVEVV